MVSATNSTSGTGFSNVSLTVALTPYGVVEDGVFELYPREAGILQERYGHRWRDGRKSVNQFSMSVYLATRLSELADEKLLIKTFGPAEGPWSYNGIISYWERA